MPQSLVVVGNGMMSFRLCQKLVACGAIGDEGRHWAATDSQEGR